MESDSKSVITTIELNPADLTKEGLSSKLESLQTLIDLEEKRALEEYNNCCRRTTMYNGDVSGRDDPFGYVPDHTAFRKMEELKGQYPNMIFAFRLVSETVRAQKGWDLEKEYREDLRHIRFLLPLLKSVLSGTIVESSLPGFIAQSKGIDIQQALSTLEE